mmetsp:Transcript_13341/g.28627  ORF Transcript_13341/g.28627 Transcript_13341/m.28627 type:complete len:249 (+) Transcript_13341:187-933(+)|eukprot:CAMPEP_0196132326 /NCGR_PEP_ID=MMETSP0910-20130528/2000_1 /TAXON_ID=49265 /ORGANISM="Thalassiosira rotula, Strain GSO102" /LENGTH=248 /DNA_ID=CAMNT_0041391927 /DNA_START=71 /DNA_END=817 /DNA_ORIENTATION=-
MIMITLTFILVCAIPTTLGFATPSQQRQRRPLLSQTLNNILSARRSSSIVTTVGQRQPTAPATQATASRRATQLYNFYDDWSNDLLSSSQSDYTYDELILFLDEECIEQCLEELMDSEYGKTMFGRHDMPASVGITGEIEFVSLEGPEAVLSLTGKFWHRRETVLGKAAMYLNARIPELTSIQVSSPSELADYEDIEDEFTGAIVGREDKRAPDFNGDRETMEYQGLDPDARGPFVFSAGGGSMIRPA